MGTFEIVGHNTLCLLIDSAKHAYTSLSHKHSFLCGVMYFIDVRF